MSAAPRRTAVPDQLLDRPQAFDLFQAIGLLERSVPGASPLGSGTGRGEAVRLSAVVSLAFPPSDVASVREADADADGPGPRWRLASPVLALAGANGPLPLPFTEMLLQRRAARDLAPLDFLDIFHHRWLSFLYRGRKKHRLGLQWQAPQDGPLLRALDALSGIGLAQGARGPGGERAWLRHAALQGPAPRSMAQLEALLRDRLGLPVRGESCVGGWQPLSPADTPRLGRGTELGRRAVLGRRAWDSSAGITLHIGPVPAGRWDALLPGGPALALLHWLVGQHAQSDLQLHVVLQPAPIAPAQWPRLGRARLGWSSWLRGTQPASAEPHAPVPVRLRLGSTAQPLAPAPN